MNKYWFYILFVLIPIPSLWGQSNEFRPKDLESKVIDELSRNKLKVLNQSLNMDSLEIPAISTTDLQANISNKETALIEYFWQDSLLFVLGLYKNGSALHKIQVDSNFISLLEGFKSNLSSKQYVEEFGNTMEGFHIFKKEAFQLYQLLLSPVLEQIPQKEQIKDLILIPDDKLGILPFEVLLYELQEDQNSISYSDLPYVLKKYNIRYYYSSLLWAKGYPRSSDARSMFGSFVPDELPYPTKHNSLQKLASELHHIEAKNIQKIIGGSLFSEESANEYAFKRFGRRYRLLHLVVPFEINNIAPDSSALLFYPFSDQENESRNQDGKLHLSEILQLRMRSEFAYLNLLFPQKIDDNSFYVYSSLIRAFHQAGCPSVATNLWDIQSQASIDLATLFFQHLNEGEEKDLALRNAKLSYLAKGEYLHPYYWANIVLYGKDVPITLGRTTAYMLLWGGLVGFLLIFGQFLKRQLLSS